MPHHIIRSILAPTNPNLPLIRLSHLFKSLGSIRTLRHLPRRAQLHRLYGRLGQSQQQQCGNAQYRLDNLRHDYTGILA